MVDKITKQLTKNPFAGMVKGQELVLLLGVPNVGKSIFLKNVAAENIAMGDETAHLLRKYI
jgi:ribosome biogenesis GTPase A